VAFQTIILNVSPLVAHWLVFVREVDDEFGGGAVIGAGVRSSWPWDVGGSFDPVRFSLFWENGELACCEVVRLVINGDLKWKIFPGMIVVRRI